MVPCAPEEYVSSVQLFRNSTHAPVRVLPCFAPARSALFLSRYALKVLQLGRVPNRVSDLFGLSLFNNTTITVCRHKCFYNVL